MIVTLTMNPAIDRTLVIPTFTPGDINRVTNTRTDAGGNGVNICRALKVMGSEAVACGFIAGSNGRFIKDYLLSRGIPSDFVEVRGETRVNIKIVDQNGFYTEINEPGFDVTDYDFDSLRERIRHYIRHDNIIILCGSTPPNFDVEKYHALCEDVRTHGAKLIVDTKGPYLIESLKSKPFFIKPNVAEMNAALGTDYKTVEEVRKGAEALVKMGAQNVAVSMGAEGAVFMRENEAIFVKAPDAPVVGPTGAGDAMVAGIAHAMTNNMDFESAAKFATAAASASVTTEGTEMPPRRTILSLYGVTEALEL